MAYFPNGTAGEIFESAECRGCIHDPPVDPESHVKETGCAVLDAHLLYNYDQIVDGETDNPLARLLTMLIDDEKPPGEMCKMRHTIESVCDQHGLMDEDDTELLYDSIAVDLESNTYCLLCGAVPTIEPHRAPCVRGEIQAA